MSRTLTRAQRNRLLAESETPTRRDSDWRAGKVFLDLVDLRLVGWRPYHAGDVSCGPGSHGGGWLTWRTPAGSALIEKARR